jgi:valyl-tRNA synthetase
MSISKVYEPKEIELKWYAYWLKHKFFVAKPNKNKKPYTIVIPPPNVTGVLHMGHMLNNTIQDVLVRKKRMQGYEALWVPGTDHASIATEAKVVAMLKERGINKKDLSREDFLKYAWEWKEKYGGIILEQLKKMGASCDWDRTRFTMEPNLSDAVIEVFCKLYEKGLIYRGARMINWDPQGKTALSDEEVIYKEGQSKLHYIKYFAAENNSTSNIQHLEFFSIATTRPETIMGDVAICVNPNDERYKHLIGKKFIVPLINRAIPIITDEAVDIDFGTGSLKVTPAHDLVDYNIGLKYNLDVIDVLTDDGQISEAAQIYVGEDRFVARKKIVKELEEKGYLIESKDITNKVGTSERTGAVIEPRISTQWFVKMKELVKPALENVLNDNIKLHPKEKFINTYKHWMENVQDWCISRQLWWGQQIPAWYDEKGNFVVAETHEKALEIYKSKFNNQHVKLTQDEDCLDTWFSSWLWPISVFDGFKDPNNEDFKYFYPTNDLVTAPEILFFWVARMIMAGYEFKGELPFRNVYLTGIVRDKLGRKMSKSLGNSPDPFDLIDKYSSDGMRVGMLLSSPAGNDLLFDEKYCEQGRNFANKIWNAFRLVKGWEIALLPDKEGAGVSIKWFENRFNQALAEIEDNYEKYRLSDALNGVYKLVWDDFCAWYLEMVKPEFGQPISKEAYDKTIGFFEKILKVLHPFMPFITEEIWHELKERSEKDCVIVAEYPTVQAFDVEFLKHSEKVLELISQIRNYRSNKGKSPKEALSLQAKVLKSEGFEDYLSKFEEIIQKLANAKVDISLAPDGMGAFIIGGIEFYIPVDKNIDSAKEKAEIQKEIDYLNGFLKSVDNKLGNEKFVANAKPEIIENERKKKADAETKIHALQKALEVLS